MKITSLKIKNFRSLEEINMQSLTDLVILIGANSCGKTNVLDALALLFNELTPEFERNLGSISDYTWFDREHNNSIEFDVTIELNQKETQDISSQELTDLFNTASASNKIQIVREISGLPTAAILKTKLIAINEFSIYGEMDGKTKKDVSSDAIGKFLQLIAQLYKSKFVFISASRSVNLSYTGFNPRNSTIRPEDLNEIRTLCQSVVRDDTKKWRKLETLSKSVAPSIDDIKVLGNELTVREKEAETPFPIYWIGGGYQEMLMVLSKIIREEGKIIGIDEPEIHLHPGLVRKLLKILKNLSKTQQIFITTHSSIFVDNSDLNNVWLVKKENNATKITHLHELEKLDQIINELGIRPSDIFYSNKIVFVEGLTEKILFPLLAKKLNINFEHKEISFIPINGKSSGKYHLKAWAEAVKNSMTPFFIILDKGAEGEVNYMTDNGLMQKQNVHILRKGDIEDYYPRKALCDVLSKEFELDIDIKDLKDNQTVKSVEGVLGSQKGAIPKSWKTIVARNIVDHMDPQDVDDEIKHALEGLASTSGLFV